MVHLIDINRTHGFRQCLILKPLVQSRGFWKTAKKKWTRCLFRLIKAKLICKDIPFKIGLIASSLSELQVQNSIAYHSSSPLCCCLTSKFIGHCIELLCVISSTILADASLRIMQTFGSGESFAAVSCMLSATSALIAEQGNASSFSMKLATTATFKVVQENTLQNEKHSQKLAPPAMRFSLTLTVGWRCTFQKQMLRLPWRHRCRGSRAVWRETEVSLVVV